MSGENEAASLAVTLARVEGKLDAYAARTTAMEHRQDDFDARLRLAASDEDLQGVDARVRAQESRAVVTPAGLFGALAATLTAVGAVSPLIAHFYS